MQRPLPPRLSTKRQLTTDNYKHGFLVDDEAIAGVTEVGGTEAPVFAAYVSHYLTGETYAYREFDRIDDALDFLGAIDRPWIYESIGCGSKKAGAKHAGDDDDKNYTSGACSSGSCGTGSRGCGPLGCG